MFVCFAFFRGFFVGFFFFFFWLLVLFWGLFFFFFLGGGFVLFCFALFVCYSHEIVRLKSVCSSSCDLKTLCVRPVRRPLPK